MEVDEAGDGQNTEHRHSPTAHDRLALLDPLALQATSVVPAQRPTVFARFIYENELRGKPNLFSHEVPVPCPQTFILLCSKFAHLGQREPIERKLTKHMVYVIYTSEDHWMVVQTVNKLVEIKPWVLFDDQIKKRPVLRVDVAVRRPPRRRAGDLRVWNMRVRHFYVVVMSKHYDDYLPGRLEPCDHSLNGALANFVCCRDDELRDLEWRELPVVMQHQNVPASFTAKHALGDEPPVRGSGRTNTRKRRGQGANTVRTHFMSAG